VVATCGHSESADGTLATRQEMVSGLRELGLGSGDLVLVSSSQGCDAAWTEEEADVWIEALLEAVGPEGTVAMHTGRGITGWPRPLFDPRTSPSEMGSISEVFRKRAGARRSGDPVGSVAALGPLAEALTQTHDGDQRRDTPWGDRAFGQESPWQRLYELNAKCLLVGGDFGTVILFRLAQAMDTESFRGRHVPEVPFPCFDQRLMGGKLEAEGLVSAVQIGPTTTKMIRARDLVDRALDLFRRDPLSYFPKGFKDRFGFTAWFRCLGFMESRLWAGLARVCITPDDLYGFRGVSRDLWARALVVRDGETSIGLVLGDQLWLNRGQVQEVRRRVQEHCGLPADNLMVACTHTHKEPNLEGGEEIAPYLEAVVDGMVEAVCRAAADIQPVRVGAARIETEGIAVNRRIKMIDGWVFTSRYSAPSTWYVPPEIIEGYGPVDPWLTTLRIEGLDGQVTGVLGNLSGHPLAAFRSKYISGDCFGRAEDLLEAVHGGSVAMLTNGAQANVIARGSIPERGPRYEPQAERMGEMIGGYWLAALAKAHGTDGGSVAAVRRRVELPLNPYWRGRVREVPASLRRPNAELLERGILLTDVQALRINDSVLVSMPGEVFVEAQLAIKEKSPFPHTIVVGLANDYVGYVPTRAAFGEGGYEVVDRPEPLLVTEDALGILVMTALEIIDQLWREHSTRGQRAFHAG